MNILYIGNKLNIHGFTPSGVEFLGNKLKEIASNVTSVSDKKNSVLRLADMIKSILSNKKNTDYIIIDTFSSASFYFAIICSSLSFLLNKKYILILRGGRLPSRYKNSKVSFDFILKRCHTIVSPSLFLKKCFSNFGYNIKYVPNFIDLNNYPFKFRNNCEPKLFWVRSFHRTYNPILAIKVLSKLISSFPNASLCMVGPEKDETMKNCKRLANKLGIADHIRFMGLMKKEDWIYLSKNYDIFLNTTNYDNQPVSILEAMALGFPIISTNVGGLPALLQNNENAILVEKDDVEGMLNAIKEIIMNESKSRMLSMNAREYAEFFDWQNIKNTWSSILKK